MARYLHHEVVRYFGWAVVLATLGGLRAAGAQNSPAPTKQATDGRFVTGKVVTPGGKPIAGAAVFWIEKAPGEPSKRRFTAHTDAQGRFRFPAPLPQQDEPFATELKTDRLRVFFPTQHEERPVFLLVQAAQWGLGMQGLTAKYSPTTALTIELKPPVTLRVSCTDPSGKPLAHVPLRIGNLGGMELPSSLHGRWERRTNGKGECVFLGLPQSGQIRFAADGEKYASPVYEDYLRLNQKALQQAPPLQLLPCGAVSGRVTNRQDGRPAPGVRVGAYLVGKGIKCGETITDAQGRYRLAGLSAGLYNVALFLTEEQEQSATSCALEKIEVKAGTTRDQQDLTLIPGSVITGRITDQSSGKPVPGVPIHLCGPDNPPSGGPGHVLITGLDGGYRARVPAGKQSIDPSMLTFSMSRYECNVKGVVVTVAEDAVLTQNFVLEPTGWPRPFRVRVVGPDDRPVPTATLTVDYKEDAIDGPELRFRSEIPVEDDGAYSFTLPPSAARLRARSGNLGTETAIEARNGADVTLHLKPNVLLTLGGQVLNTRNQPIEGAKVSVPGWVDTATDAQGHFTFTGLYPDNEYVVSATARGYGSQQTPALKYKPGEQATTIILHLPAADRIVTGRAVDSNGVPFAYQIVALLGDTSSFQTASTDAQGRFRFENVVKEPITLFLLQEKGAPYSASQKAQGGDKDVLLVIKASAPPAQTGAQK